MSWRIAHGQTVRMLAWQHECVVFNDLSGDTHLLGAAAATVLCALQAGPAGTAVLAATLAASLSLPLDAQLRDEVDALLDELAQFFLIEPAC